MAYSINVHFIWQNNSTYFYCDHRRRTPIVLAVMSMTLDVVDQLFLSLSLSLPLLMLWIPLNLSLMRLQWRIFFRFSRALQKTSSGNLSRGLWHGILMDNYTHNTKVDSYDIGCQIHQRKSILHTSVEKQQKHTNRLIAESYIHIVPCFVTVSSSLETRGDAPSPPHRQISTTHAGIVTVIIG